MISQKYNRLPYYVNPRPRGAARPFRVVGTGTATRSECLFTSPYLGAPLEGLTHPPRFHLPPAPLRTAQTLGTSGSRNGDIECIHVFRTSARFIRNAGKATTDTRGRRPHHDPEERRRIVKFLQDHNLPIPKDPDALADLFVQPLTSRGEIDHFSRKSKARLKFKAGNCYPYLISQFCLTWPQAIAPKTGKIAKQKLDNFLRCLRRKYKDSAYLWILEFQRNGSPHFHLYLSFPPDRQKREWMASTWARIIGAEGDTLEKCLRVHSNPRNFIPWDMKKGGYLTKYLEKQYQKLVPTDFLDVGRFWGASQNLTTPSDIILFSEEWEPLHHIDTITGEVITTDLKKDIPRIARKHHESTLRLCGNKRKSRLRDRNRATTNLPSAGALIFQYLLWFDREKAHTQGIKNDEVPF